MSDERDEPGTGTGTGDAHHGDLGPGRRRARVDHVADELAALRRDLTTTRDTLDSTTGHLAEALPRLDQLEVTVIGLAATVTALTRAHDEQARVDAAELEARRAAGLADEPPAPWAWPVLDRPTAQAAWEALGRWVATVLCREHQLPLRRLPMCWPRHPGAVAELTALRAAHVAAHSRGAHPGAALAWSRDLPAALDRLTGRHRDEQADAAIDPTRCPPGLHHVDPATLPAERERDRVGALPSTPETWWPALRHVVAADLAGRREPPAEA